MNIGDFQRTLVLNGVPEETLRQRFEAEEIWGLIINRIAAREVRISESEIRDEVNRLRDRARRRGTSHIRNISTRR